MLNHFSYGNNQPMLVVDISFDSDNLVGNLCRHHYRKLAGGNHMNDYSEMVKVLMFH